MPEFSSSNVGKHDIHSEHRCGSNSIDFVEKLGKVFSLPLQRSKRLNIYSFGTSSAKTLNIPIEYSKSVCDIYCELVRTLIEHNGDLAILCLWNSNLDNYRAGLPSWVPDWSCSSHSALLFDPRDIDQTSRASRKVTVHDPLSKEEKNPFIPENGIQFTIERKPSKRRKCFNSLNLASSKVNHKTISVRGTWFDSVSHLGESAPDALSSPDDWKTTVLRWEALAVSTRRSSTSQTIRFLTTFACTGSAMG